MEPDSLNLLAANAAATCTSKGEEDNTTTSTGVPDHRLGSARSGNSWAFRELVCANQSVVYSLALRILGVREDAQELAQDVFMLLHHYLADVHSVSHLRFWLRKTTCHRAIDRLRRRARVAVLPLDAVAELEAPAEDNDLLMDRRLRQFIAQLPAMPRAVLLLRYQEDLDPPEIAMTLGLPLNTVKSHLRRSLALLRSRCSGLLESGTEKRK